MTIIVGILTTDGIVVGSDSAATFSNGQTLTIEQTTKKVDIISEEVIVAGTGQVGLGQRFKAIVQKNWEKKLFQKNYIEVGKEISHETLQDFAYTSAIRGQFGALLAFASGNKPYLCEFSVNDFQPEFKEIDKLWYVSMGSGQAIADPFLGFLHDTFWNSKPPPINDAIFAVIWTLQHAIKINPGGVNGPIQIAVLKPEERGKLKASLLSDIELDEHHQNVSDAISHLRSYPEILLNKYNKATSIPT